MNIVELLTFSVERRASDLHLSSGQPPMMRIDGELPALEQAAVLALVHEVMNERQRRDYEEFFEVDFSFDIQGVARFRVNVFNQQRGAVAVFRVVPLRVPTSMRWGRCGCSRRLSPYPVAWCW